MEFIAVSVLMFLAGMAVGICVMYIADSRYIRIIRKSCNNITLIYRSDANRLKEKLREKERDNERLYNIVNALQMKIAEYKEREGINA